MITGAVLTPCIPSYAGARNAPLPTAGVTVENTDKGLDPARADSSEKLPGNTAVISRQQVRSLFEKGERVTELEPRWVFQAKGAITSPAVMGSNGTLYVATEDGRLYALWGGLRLWECTARGTIKAPPQLGPDGAVYVKSDRSICAIKDGKEQWAYNSNRKLLDTFRVSPDGTVFVISDVTKKKEHFWESSTYKLLALRDGGKKWDVDDVYAFDVGADGTLYAGTGDEKLENARIQAIREERNFLGFPRGKMIWELETRDRFIGPMALTAGSDGTVYASSAKSDRDENLFYAVKDGKKRWEYRTKGWLSAGSTPGPDGTVYITATGGAVLAFNGGMKLWEYCPGVDGGGRPVVGPDNTVFIRRQKSIIAIREGRKVGEYQANSLIGSLYMGPDGVLYAGSDDGALYAFDVKGHRETPEEGKSENSEGNPLTAGEAQIESLDGWIIIDGKRLPVNNANKS